MALSPLSQVGFQPKEIRFAGSQTGFSVLFHFDAESGRLYASLKRGENHYTVAREKIQGIPDDWSYSQISQFIPHAICNCSEERMGEFQLALSDPQRQFIEELSAKKMKELETSSSSLDEIVQAQNGPQFIYEFIQNACDAASGDQREVDVSFVLHEDALVISHSGRHFDEEDIKTISTSQRKDSAKRADALCIGYKGVGFKSVFNHSDAVMILSRYSFRFDKHAEEWNGKADFPWELCPLYTPPGPLIEKYRLDPERVNFVIPLNRPGNRIALHLNDFYSQKAPEVFFFLHRLKRLTFEVVSQTPSKVCYEKAPIYVGASSDDPPSEESDPEVETESYALSKNGEVIGRWLRYKRTLTLTAEIQASLKQESRIPARYKEMKTTPIAFIHPLDHNGVAKRERIYCYLPTEVSLGLPVPLNGHFFLDISRKSLQQDNPFNEYLFECIGETLFHFYAYIAKRYPDHFFTILAHPQQLTFDTNVEKYRSHFVKGAERAMASLAFLPAQLKGVLKPHEAVIDEWSFVSRFGSVTEKKSVLRSCPNAVFALLERFGVSRYSWDKIVARIKNRDFVKWVAANPQQGLALIRYFKALYERKQFQKEIKEVPFLLSHFSSESKELLFTPTAIFFPHESHLEGLDFVRIALIHPQVRAELTEEERKWLTTDLFVRSATLAIYVEEVNRAKSEELVFRVLRVLYRNFPASQIPPEFKSLRLPVQLKKEERQFAAPHECYLPDALQPLHALQGEVTPRYPFFLSENLYKECPEGERPLLRSFFLALEVNERVTDDNILRIIKSLETDKQKILLMRLLYHQLFLVEGQETAFQACVEILHNQPLFKTNRGEFKRPSECFLPTAYQPQMDLFSASVQARNHLSFLSEEYMEDPTTFSSWKKFFLALGVREKLEIHFFDSMRVTDFEDKLRKELQETGWQAHAASNPYFNYIEYLWQKTDYPPSNSCLGTKGQHTVPFSTVGCAPTNGYRSQHTLSPVIWIEYFFLIKGSALFWQIVKEHWEAIKQRCESSSLYKTICSFRDQGIPSMLHFYSQEGFSDESGSRWSAPNIYAPSLRWLVSPLFPAVSEDLPLNEEQLSYFPFRMQISLEDCFRLLRSLQDQPINGDNENRVAAIYHHILSSDATVEPPEDLQLLTEEGSFKKPKELFGNGIEGLTFKGKASCLLKRLPGFSVDEHLALCRIFRIEPLLPSSLMLEEVEARPEPAFKELVIRRLPFAFTASQAPLDALVACARKVEQLHFVTASEINLRTELRGHLFREAVFAWQLGDVLYGRENFQNSRTIGQTAHLLCQLLQLPCHTAELAHLLSSADQQIADDFSYKGETETYSSAQVLAQQVEEQLKIPMAAPAPAPLPSTPNISPIKPTNPPSPIRATSSSLKRQGSFSLSSASPHKKFAAESFDHKPRPISVVNYSRLAEEAVFNYYVRKYQESGEGTATKRYPDTSPWDRKVVRWVNFPTESFANYDFQIDYFKGDTLVKTKYLDAKSKEPDSQFLSTVSLSEDEAARMNQAKENYSLWIVKFFHDDPPKLFKVTKPLQKIEAGTITAEWFDKPQLRLQIDPNQLIQK